MQGGTVVSNILLLQFRVLHAELPSDFDYEIMIKPKKLDRLLSY